MAQSQNTQENLRLGIEAARRGEKLEARRYLQFVLTADRNNEIAWMWMASVVDTVDERRQCLERALQINPNNQRAREALRRLGVNVAATAETNTPRRREQDIRDYQLPSKTIRRGRGLLENPYLLAAALLGAVLVVLAVLTLISLADSGGFAPAQPQDAIQQTFNAIVLPTASPTRDRRPPTATPFLGVIVSLTPAFTLPSTFTPTPTETPTEAPPPTATPFPLSEFRILYADREFAEAEPVLFSGVAAVDTSELKVGLLGFTDVALSPDAQWVAFVRDVLPEDGPARPQLFVAALNALDQAQPLTSLPNGTRMNSPAWSPDGQLIAFSSDEDGDFELYLIPASGGTPIRLTNNSADDMQPNFSPDGSRIVFASDRDSLGILKLYTISLDGSQVTPLLRNFSGNNFSPVYSPDGSRIAFVSDRAGVGKIYVMNADGSNPVLITDNDNRAENRSPAWSPDGRWIAFASTRGGDGFQWWASEVDGVNRRVVRLKTTDRFPQTILFVPIEAAR